MTKLLLVTLGFAVHSAFAAPPVPVLTSPDRHVVVDVHVTAAHTLEYSIRRDGQPVILPSRLGLQLEGADLSAGLELTALSSVKLVSDSYELATGKKRHISYRANEQVVTVRNAAGQAMDVVFRVSNDGVAFRYRVREPGLPIKKFVAEATSFRFDAGARAWLQPMSVAQTGWSNTNPSYEEHYRREIAVGTPSPLPSGWVFPALFRTGATWVALSEAGLDGSWHASRLQADSSGGIYRLGQPMAAEVIPGGALLAESRGELSSPWRLIALGSMRTVMESTLGTDLAAPVVAFDAAPAKPGHASWSWALLKDDATVFAVQKKFIDYAAEMHWDYTLVDADWDRKIGYDKLGELAAYAASKGIGLLAWYNSSGDWNTTPYTPKSRLLTHEQRMAEFARLRAMGVKGIKVDFFGGDGKSMIAYYIDILNDAAQAGLLVNFHGATLPRGWARTWPNLMTAEAVRGLEFTTFTQEDQDAVPAHAAMLPFTRNLFDPMDFTPMVFGDIPNIRRATHNGFELAESVLFLSGIQHFAETPEGMAGVPGYVKSFLQDLPRSWDEMRFVDGYPSRYAVIARKSGDSWYLAGFNGGDTDLALDLDLGFLRGLRGQLITDGRQAREFVQSPIAGGGKQRIGIKAHGGFAGVFKK
ncbi:glycoside hydrolase family 97 catalytic domain-containing protein [Massilia norwichensis]|uniref:Glycoside hydrolase family 97 protein n=1 Tax=Massilia norwichensis TaxID=1442366 RepID=A0ABT2A3T9_9BURK|nr:glycoside hydrolase family 97 protein [Massilia norwichensis]MCS0588862.1 glycoside hydrolase family 97 protein [Massilia norwichensis]